MIKKGTNLNLSLLGNASIFAGQFETFFFINRKFSVTIGLGVGYNEEFTLFSDKAESYLIIPIHLTLNLVSRDRHFFMFGMGYANIDYGDQGEDQHLHNSHYYYPIIAYRMQATKWFNFGPYISYPIYPKGIDLFEDIMFIPFGFIFGISF